jgi:hypothetical protein
MLLWRVRYPDFCCFIRPFVACQGEGKAQVFHDMKIISLLFLCFLGAVGSVMENIDGKISAVDTAARTISVTTSGGENQTYTVSDTASITLNEKSSTLGSLLIGMEVLLTPSEISPSTVSTIEAKGEAAKPEKKPAKKNGKTNNKNKKKKKKNP